MRHDELFRLYLVFQEMRIAGVQVRHAMQCSACYYVHDMTWHDMTGQNPGSRVQCRRHCCHPSSPLTSRFYLTSYSCINQADAAVYNTLINACAGVGDLEKALETVQAMQVTHKPSFVTHKPWLYQNFSVFFIIEQFEAAITHVHCSLLRRPSAFHLYSLTDFKQLGLHIFIHFPSHHRIQRLLVICDLTYSFILAGRRNPSRCYHLHISAEGMRYQRSRRHCAACWRNLRSDAAEDKPLLEHHRANWTYIPASHAGTRQSPWGPSKHSQVRNKWSLQTEVLILKHSSTT